MMRVVISYDSQIFGENGEKSARFVSEETGGGR